MPVILQEQPVNVATVVEEETSLVLREEQIPVEVVEEVVDCKLQEEFINVTCVTEIINVSVSCVCLPETGVERFERVIFAEELSPGLNTIRYFVMPPGKKVEFVFVHVLDSLAEGAYLTVGTSSDLDLLLASDEADLSYEGQYQKSVNLDVAAGSEFFIYVYLPKPSKGKIIVTTLLE